MCYYCRNCNYIYQIPNDACIISHQKREEKKNAEIFTDEDLKEAQVCHEHCPKCDYDKTYFIEIQIRSLDEPSTKFYMCSKCKYKWRSDN